MKYIFTHENADFDALASALAAHRLYPEAIPVLPKALDRNVAEFMALHHGALPFISWKEMRKRANQIDGIIVVDTIRIPQVRHMDQDAPILIIDHHPLEDTEFPANVTFTGEVVGAATTLIIEKLREKDVHIPRLEATLMALGIYSDTGSLTYGTTTPRDAAACAWLLEKQANLDIVRQFLAPPLDAAQQDLYSKLLPTCESREIHGHTVIVCAVRIQHHVNQINSVVHQLRNLLNSDAIIVLVQMPSTFQLIARSQTDAIDVGVIAAHFGGGGHGRAAAAHFHRENLDEARAELWRQIEHHVQPMVRVVDLMSYGVQTVQADDLLTRIIQQLRRIGHEGYPVLQDGRVIGLLTRRDADRALEHGLSDATAREVMDGGFVALHPDDPVSKLEQVMAESGWGQIPVIDEDNTMIGIVTRTDLISHWAKIHAAESVQPGTMQPGQYITSDQIVEVLGEPAAVLIRAITKHAQANNTPLYMVGGVVRDLLLHRANDDIDFVVESNAIDFAETVCKTLGGTIHPFHPFGTAKWWLDETVTVNLGVGLEVLPEHIDFATSRNEFYNHPTALPSVYNSSIKLDLHRRDFTINTLAIQLSPEHSVNRILDFYGGLNDLNQAIIRVLHSLSFVDDPTRVLRAIRFEFRLDFTIEDRTAELIRHAYPMLRRITGERLRNELKHLLDEPTPERALLAMESRGILPAIHPDFHFHEITTHDFIRARTTRAHWPVECSKPRHLYWHLIMARIDTDAIHDLAERLLFSRQWIHAFLQTTRLMQTSQAFGHEEATISDIVHEIEPVPDHGLLAAWIMGTITQQKHITQYLHTWWTITPTVNGHDLKRMGLPPGPIYREILDKLRDARLDGEIITDDEEQEYARTLVQEALHDNV